MSNGYICRNEYLNISILGNHIKTHDGKVPSTTVVYSCKNVYKIFYVFFENVLKSLFFIFKALYYILYLFINNIYNNSSIIFTYIESEKSFFKHKILKSPFLHKIQREFRRHD